jgi:hypothetical protein
VRDFGARKSHNHQHSEKEPLRGGVAFQSADFFLSLTFLYLPLEKNIIYWLAKQLYDSISKK